MSHDTPPANLAVNTGSTCFIPSELGLAISRSQVLEGTAVRGSAHGDPLPGDDRLYLHPRPSVGLPLGSWRPSPCPLPPTPPPPWCALHLQSAPPHPLFLAHPTFTPHALCWQVEAEAWGAQLGAGISSVGLDSTLYDHVLDTICWVGAIPQRFQVSHNSVGESSEAVGAIICWVGAIPQCGTPACNQPCSPADFSSLLVDMPLPVPLVRPVPDSPPPP